MVKVSLFNELDKTTGESMSDINPNGEHGAYINLGVFNDVQWTYGLIRLKDIDEEEIYLEILNHDSILYKGKVFGDFLIEGV